MVGGSLPVVSGSCHRWSALYLPVVGALLPVVGASLAGGRRIPSGGRRLAWSKWSATI